FSAWVNNKLKVDDRLNVFLPEGRFVFKSTSANQGKTYAAFAAGSGITPVMAILRDVLEAEPESKFVLVYGNKTPKETIFYKDLLTLMASYPQRLFVEFVYSKSKEDKSFFGRIERSTVNYVLKNKFKEEAFEAFYLCGPEPMIDAVSAVLKENGIDEHKIHFELLVTDKGDSTKEEAVGNEGKTMVT